MNSWEGSAVLRLESAQLYSTGGVRNLNTAEMKVIEITLQEKKGAMFMVENEKVC